MTKVVWPHRESPMKPPAKAADVAGMVREVVTVVAVAEEVEARVAAPAAAEPVGETSSTFPEESGPQAVEIGETPVADEHVAKAPDKDPAPDLTRTVRVIMAGGGTGGHLYPGLAVAEALQKRLGEHLELVWAATPRPVDERLLGKYGTAYVKQPVQPLVRRISKLLGFWNGWRETCTYWKQDFTEHKADLVLALGGYAAGPAAYVAGRFGVPVALLNPDALPGMANRFLLKRADRIFTQWDLPAHLRAKIHGRVMAAGCPIRGELDGRTREEGARRLGLDPAKRTLVVMGGSLAAKTINDALMVLLGDQEVGSALVGSGGPGSSTPGGVAWQVIHLAGAEQSSDVRAVYEPIKAIVWQVLDYCDDMGSVWAVADLAIARAGASTCAELTACGVPSILLPYPYHRDLHQRHNAMKLVEAGAALLVDDKKDAQANAAGIKKALLTLMYDGKLRETMARQARACGKPHAARDIAAELISMIRI